jgi:hypothetical protein
MVNQAAIVSRSFGEPLVNDAYMIGANLLKTGTVVDFRLVQEEVLPALDGYAGDLNFDERLVADLITACRSVATKLDLLAPIPPPVRP